MRTYQSLSTLMTQT